MDHIKPTLGNVLFVVLVGAAGTFSVLAFLKFFASQNIPGVTPVAQGTLKLAEESLAA